MATSKKTTETNEVINTATETVSKELGATEPTTEVKEVKKESKKDLRKLINKDTEVVIMNNTAGMFVYQDDRSKNYFEMQTYGDTDVMTVDELINMRNKHRAILEKYWIVPVECSQDGVELSDIIRYLSLDSLYKDGEISYETIDNILLNTNFTKFVSLVEKINNNLVERLVERGAELYKQKRFVDMTKMKVLEKRIAREGFFSELDEE